MSAPAMLNSVRGMSVPRPLQSLDVYMNDPRTTWNESLGSPQRAAYGTPEISPNNALGDVTRVNSPINDMVVRLESFSEIFRPMQAQIHQQRTDGLTVPVLLVRVLAMLMSDSKALM